MKKTLFFALLLLLSSLTAQISPWVNYTYNSSVRAIAREGNILWIGTTGGLVRYDTTTGDKAYYNVSNSGIPYNYVNAIAIDANGTKWIGSGEYASSIGGLASFDGETWTSYTIPDNGIGSRCVLSLAFDHTGNLWVGTYNGLQKYNGDTWTLYHVSNTPVDLRVILSLAVDIHNRIWVGTEWYGLKSFDGETWTEYVDPTGYGQSVMALCFAPDGSLWMSAYQPYGMGALVQFDGNIWTAFTATQIGLSFYEVECVDICPDGTVWIGTLNGAGKYDGTTWTTFTPTNSSLSNRYVYAIEALNSDNVWVGTGGSGIYHHETDSWTQDSLTSNGLVTNSIGCIAVDAEDRPLIGTQYGILRLENGYWQRWTEAVTGIVPAKINSILVAPNGCIWYTQYNGGIIKYDGTAWTHYTSENSILPSNYAGELEVGPDGSIWTNITGGLLQINGTEWTIYNSENTPMPAASPGAIEFDHSGNLWMSFSGTGIMRYDGTNWTLYSSALQMPLPQISNIVHDGQGKIWYWCANSAYVDYRIVTFDGTEWESLNPAIGEVPFNYYRAGMHDELGNMWFGVGGLMRLDETGWTEYSYTNSDQAGAYVMGIARDTIGKLWLATNNGVVSYQYAPSATDDPVLTPVSAIRAYPNPFGSELRIEIPRGDEPAQASIYNLRGQLVSTLRNGEIKGTEILFRWDGKDKTGKDCPTGIYFIRYGTKEKARTAKILRIR